MIFWFVLSLKSLMAAISLSSIPLALVAPNRGYGTTPGAQGMVLYVSEGFHSFRQSKLECSCHESCVLHICSRINNFYIYAFYHNQGHDGSLYDCLLHSVARVQSVDDKAHFVFVGDPNAHHSAWLESVYPTDHQGRDALDFSICQVVSSLFQPLFWVVDLKASNGLMHQEYSEAPGIL